MPRKNLLLGYGAVIFALVLSAALISYDSFESLYDATYVGAEVCGDCHVQVFPQWQRSPHANMTRLAGTDSVVGNFNQNDWYIHKGDGGALPDAKMYQDGDRFVMALRNPNSEEYTPFPIERVVGYQYRQVYLTREPGGVLRRMPLQWSTEQQDFFSYWNFQEQSPISVTDLWAQMQPLNSAWNLFCARCHTTKLAVASKNAKHTEADTHWVDDGIACEACHGPGSSHVNYMSGNPVNRVAAFLNSKARAQPVAYIANAQKLKKGEAMSVCARCHGADIFRKTMDKYRLYEPGYSESGAINDLSVHFQETPLQPHNRIPTLETWADSRPKGIGMLFRSFIESQCYQASEPRCFNCHNPHDNKQPAKPGLLASSSASNAYCLECHQATQAQVETHTQHQTDEKGSYCYDCHMPKHIMVAATGVTRWSRTHTMSSIPDPQSSITHGQENAPNACNDCHQNQSPQWALEKMKSWQPFKTDALQSFLSGK